MEDAAVTEARRLVRLFFDDEAKADLWFKTPNPAFGNLAPKDLIQLGRSKQLLRWIENRLAENEP